MRTLIQLVFPLLTLAALLWVKDVCQLSAINAQPSQ